MNKWKNIWDRRNITQDTVSNLQKLISIDGFDTGYGTISEDEWLCYVTYIQNKLKMKSNDSIYEVGCGAGAFLYPFYKKYLIGGLDYSDKLIQTAKEYLPKGSFKVTEAVQCPIEVKYDYVISNSVFFYFDSYEYAERVLEKMITKATKGIAVLEVNDYEKIEESMKLRKGYLSDEEYTERYEGLEHLYYKKQWFIEIAKKHNLEIEIEQQNINNYANNIYRFNVFMFKK